MYLKYYDLAIKPFDLSLKPGFLWLGEKHSEAFATLQYGIQEDLGFLLLTGDVGAGKTVMIRRLVDSLDKKSTIIAHITDPGLEQVEFFKMLASEFKLPGGYQNKADFLIQFEKFLQKACDDKKKVLLIIDEAQRLDDSLLDQIRVLSNIERGDRKLINIFFIGQPEFKNMLLEDVNRPLRQRIAVNYHIDPLTEPEVAQYIVHRLQKAGRTRHLFNPDAVHEIYKFTQGYPRAVNIICDHALLTGFSSELEQIDSNVIKECKQELKIKAELQKKEEGEEKKKDEPEPSPPELAPYIPPPQKSLSSLFGGYSLIIGICILLSALLVYLLVRPDPSETIQTEQQDKSAEFSNQPTKPLENDQWRLDDKIELDKSYASSKLPSGSLSQNPSNMETEEAVAKEEGVPQKDLLPLPASPKLDPPEEITEKTPVVEKKNDEALEKQVAVATKNPEIAPDQPKTTSATSEMTAKKDSSVAVPDKSLQAMAVMSAAMAAKPKTEPVKSAPVKTTKKSAAEKPKAKSTAIKKKPTPTTTKSASTSKKPTSTKPTTKKPVTKTKEIKGNVTPLEKAEPNTALTAVIAASEPKNSAASPATASGDKTAGGGTSSTATTSVSTVPESKSSPKKESAVALENRLRWFLKSYCVTYTRKDIDAFAKLFVPGATENGKPFETLIPRYKKNFDHIETIQYRIDMQNFSYDDSGESILVEGNFSLQWLPGDRKWRENSGTISMALIDNGESFLVQRLDYKGRPKK